MSRVVRCVFLFTAYITVMMSVPPSVPVLHANGSCACSGYVYAYDYYPVYGQYEGEASVSGSDDNATDYGYCANFCNYVAVLAGVGLCNSYSLGGGKGFTMPDYSWYFYDGQSYSAHVSGIVWDC
jgi:hypothetical protein